MVKAAEYVVVSGKPHRGRRPRRHPHRPPQGGILSPLLANIALSVLDEHLHRPWEPGGTMSTAYLRSRRRVYGLPRWRIVRYADDFVILVHGERAHAEDLREDVATVLKPLGLRLSEAKTLVVHMSDGFDFLGFHIQWKRKMGTNKWHVYTFIADRPIRSVKAKIRALTRRTSQQDPATVLIRLNQIMRGWQTKGVKIRASTRGQFSGDADRDVRGVRGRYPRALAISCHRRSGVAHALGLLSTVA